MRSRGRGLPAWARRWGRVPTLFARGNLARVSPHDTLVTLVLMIAVATSSSGPSRPLAGGDRRLPGLLGLGHRGTCAGVSWVIRAFLLSMRVGWNVLVACLARVLGPGWPPTG